MAKVLIIAEHDGSALNPSTAKALSAALELNTESVDIVVFGHKADAVVAQAASLAGVGTVKAVSSDVFAEPVAADLAPEVAAMAADYTHIFAGSTTFGRDLMPRVAGLLKLNQVSDVMAVLDERTFKRPIYAGNAIVTIHVPQTVDTILATIRTASFAAAAEGGNAAIESLASQTQSPGHTRYVGREGSSGQGPDLSSAPRVVSGGRALGSAENFQIIYRLANKLGAAVGASRAAVDAGYVPNELQVGQTGKIIAPDLYIAVGISGAIQHLTGIKDAGTIVAINKDSEAPIFEVADLGLVGDLFELIPELEQLI